MAELAARSLHDQKVLGLNPAGSNSDQLVSITRFDGFRRASGSCPSIPLHVSAQLFERLRDNHA